MRLSWRANAGFSRRDGGVGSGRSRYSQTVAATFGSSASGSRSIDFLSGAGFAALITGGSCGTRGWMKRAGTTFWAPGRAFADEAALGCLSLSSAWARDLSVERAPATFVLELVLGADWLAGASAGAVSPAASPAWAGC